MLEVVRDMNATDEEDAGDAVAVDVETSAVLLLVVVGEGKEGAVVSGERAHEKAIHAGESLILMYSD